MSPPGMVEERLITVEDPAVGKMPRLSVILCHDTCADRVSKTLPSALIKSHISLAGIDPISIFVLSYVIPILILWVSEIGYPDWNPKPFELLK